MIIKDLNRLIRYVLSALFLIAGMADIQAQYYMNIFNKDGSMASYLIEDIDSICFDSYTAPLQYVRMKAERLPDMLYPRADFALYAYGNEIIAAGGHTTGFDAISTAEYFDGREWHETAMIDYHDMPFSVVLPDGRLMVGGECPGGYGVGQSSYVELYDPNNHSFSMLSQMNLSRTLSHAAVLSDNAVLVSGNWYASDGTELYTIDKDKFDLAVDVSEDRNLPYIFPTGKDKALIFGPSGNYGGGTELIVDRIGGGEPFSVSLFEEWTPMGLFVNWRPDDCMTSNYSYLFAARNYDGKYGIIKLDGAEESFSLLPLADEIPTVFDGEEIEYYSHILVDKRRNVAYMPGFNKNVDSPVYFLLKIDYKTTPASLTVYYTDILDAYVSPWSITIAPDGSLVMAGGIYDSNFSPFNSVWRLFPF